MAHRPFRFGLSLRGFDHGHDWAEVAAKVEDLGYSTLLVPDHLGDQLAPLPALGAAAAASTTLRLGTFVLDNDFRHPVILAKEAATVDVLSHGRFELGLGAGWRADERAAAGIPFDRAGVRVDRLTEAVAVVKGLWSGEPFSFEGEHYRVQDLSGRPRPVQRPGPPLFLGGGGPRLLALAGREADVVGLAPRAGPGGPDLGDGTPEALDAKLAVLRTAAGERAAVLELNALVLVAEITADRETRLATLSRRTGRSSAELLASPHVLLGTVDEVVEDLLVRRERFGLSYVVVPEPALETFAPVLSRLAGT